MSAGVVRVSPSWLVLREPADAAARSAGLAERLRPHPSADGSLVVHDLGGGSGAMARWLAPRLAGPQHWVVHDRDADLLEVAVADPPVAAGGAPVTVEARLSDVTRLTSDDLARASLITASALLDLLTADGLNEMLGAATGTSAPMLFALTVVGRVALTPAEPFDRRLGAAFDAHQRRMTAAGPLLGPDAVAAATEALGATGAEVLVRPSPWRLDGTHADLTAEWLDGWLDAACEQEPELAAEAGAYRDRRLGQLAAGALAVTVHHADLLAVP
jgi:hypothetical protein